MDFDNLKDLEQVRDELKEHFETGEYKNELIRKELCERKNLRKVYCLVLINSPARFGEFFEKTCMPKKTVYNNLYKLVNLGLLKQIAVMNIWNKKPYNDNDVIVLNKFKDWTIKMSSPQIQKFAAKTNYWTLTNLGMDKKIINWALQLEKEEKNGAENIQGDGDYKYEEELRPGISEAFKKLIGDGPDEK